MVRARERSRGRRGAKGLRGRLVPLRWLGIFGVCVSKEQASAVMGEPWKRCDGFKFQGIDNQHTPSIRNPPNAPSHIPSLLLIPNLALNNRLASLFSSDPLPHRLQILIFIISLPRLFSFSSCGFHRRVRDRGSRESGSGCVEEEAGEDGRVREEGEEGAGSGLKARSE